jgi:uncharacterized protein (DUF4415 family)
MSVKSNKSAPPWTDPDDAPEITANWVAEATLYEGEKLIRRGRPVGSTKASAKVQTAIRFDPDVLDGLRATGRGWQTRVNDAMRDWLKAHSVS